MNLTHALVRLQAYKLPDSEQTKLWEQVWLAVVYRAQNLGECHSREALPQVLYDLIGRCHHTVRLAVALATLERDKVAGHLDAITLSGTKAGNIVVRSNIETLPEGETELPMPKVEWGD